MQGGGATGMPCPSEWAVGHVPEGRDMEEVNPQAAATPRAVVCTEVQHCVGRATACVVAQHCPSI